MERKVINQFWETMFFSHRECHWFLSNNAYGDVNFCVIKKSWKMKMYGLKPERMHKNCTGVCELFVPDCKWDYSRVPNDIIKEMKERARKVSV